MDYEQFIADYKGLKDQKKTTLRKYISSKPKLWPYIPLTVLFNNRIATPNDMEQYKEKDYADFLMKIYHRDPKYKEHLLDLMCKGINKFNYSKKNVAKNFKLLQSMFPQLDLKRFNFGSNGVYFLGIKNKSEDHYVINLYPTSKKKIVFNQVDGPPIERSGHHYYMSNGNITVTFTNKNPTLEYIFYTHKEEAVYDGKHVYCMPFYDVEPLPRVPIPDDLSLFDPPHPLSIKTCTKMVADLDKQKTGHVGVHRPCYCCRKIYHKQYYFEPYPSMCFDCGIMNYEQRNEMGDLSDYTMYVSGCRIKIGYCICLKALRCGATVIGSTRWPRAAWYNYQQESDYEEWKDRLTILKCNYLNGPEVYQLIEFLKDANLNCIIMNAFQTIRPNQEYFQKACLLEGVLEHHDVKMLEYNVEEPLLDSVSHAVSEITNMEKALMYSGGEVGELVIAPINTQTDLVPIFTEMELGFNQFGDIDVVIPTDETCWYKKHHQIKRVEKAEGMIINMHSPTEIIDQLTEHMQDEQYILYVSSVEGRTEDRNGGGHYMSSDTNPYNKLSKAGMNNYIFTLSQNPDPKFHAWVIDPGFVSSAINNMESFPLTSMDGAARVLHPLIAKVNGKPLPKKWVHLKDYLDSPL